MVWSSTITARTKAGNKRIHYGTWDGAGVAGGDIDTGLTICENILLTHKAAAVAANAAVINETLPAAGNAITVVCTAGDAGFWVALGY